MKPPRIALVSDAVLPFNKGGKETRIYYLTRELVRLGYQVDIYTMRWWDKGRTYNNEGITYHALCRRYPLYKQGRRSIAQGILFGLASLKMVFYKFDILEVDHMPFFQLYSAKLVCLIRRKPLYATWHEVWGRPYWREYLGHYKGIVADLVERSCVKLPDHIIAVSNQTQLELRQKLHYKGPITLISNGIDYGHIATIKPARQNYDVIYAGRLLAHKHVDLLIEAIAHLRRTQPAISCLIIGDGPEFAKLTQMVQALGLENNVTMAGFKDSSDEVLAAMKSARVFVLPSSREGFGISILEAYACGLQAVTVDCESNAARHLIKAGTGQVCALKAPAIAAAIEDLLEAKPSPKLIRQAAENYNWRTSAAALYKVYAV
jgi:glycosyltransferase involved in cell wall biosynthesis